VRLRHAGGPACAFQLYLEGPTGLGLYTPEQSLAIPADAMGALVVGASRAAAWPKLDMPEYSARGPAKSGIEKPDLVAPSSVHLESIGTTLEGTCVASSIVGSVAVLAWQRLAAQLGNDVESISRRVSQALRHTAREPAWTAAPVDRNAYGRGLLDVPECLRNVCTESRS
jgi:hypothetical protein